MRRLRTVHDRIAASARGAVRLDGTTVIVILNVILSALAHIVRIVSLSLLSPHDLSALWCSGEVISAFTGVFLLIALASIVDLAARAIAGRRWSWSRAVIHVASIVLALGNIWVFLELYLGPATLCTFREIG